MRILGIDPGYATVGFGVVDYVNSKFTCVDYGAISDPPQKRRLRTGSNNFLTT